MSEPVAGSFMRWEANRGVFVSGVSDGVEAGRSQSADPFADATAVWGAGHGYGTLRAHHPDFLWPQDEQSWIRDAVRRLARIVPEDEDPL